MQIVVLDGYTLNPGDLSWASLKALGSCRVYDRTSPAETRARCEGAGILLTNKTVLDGALISTLPELRYIGVMATGYNVVDLAAARARQIPVTNVPAYSTPSVVQLTFALLLELTHQVGQHARGVREGRWSASPDFCYWETPLVELAGRAFGIVGFGNVGQGVAGVAAAFGCRVLVHTRTPPSQKPPACGGARLPPSHPEADPDSARPQPRPTGFMAAELVQTEQVTSPASAVIQFVDLPTVFRESDVVSLHCPLTEATRHLVNRERLAMMKPSAYLLNCGRGPLVDEAALAEALNAGRLAGAGLDVLSTEPPAPDNPLLQARHCVVTPHIGWATRAARERLLATVVGNVRAFLAGRPQQVVN